MALCDKEIKLEVTTGKLFATRDRCPLAEGDRLTVGGAICQCIAADNILLQHISEAFFIASRSILLADLANHLTEQPFSAGLGIIGQDVNTIARAHCNKALELPFCLGERDRSGAKSHNRQFDRLKQRQFPPQYLDKEIAVATGRLKKATVEPERLVAHQVKHSVHLPWIGEHLAMLSHPLAALDLYFYIFLCGHKKESWIFTYDSLGVPRPVKYTSKAHDYLVGVYRFTILDLILWNFKESVYSENALYYVICLSIVSICCIFSYFFDCKDLFLHVRMCEKPITFRLQPVAQFEFYYLFPC